MIDRRTRSRSSLAIFAGLTCALLATTQVHGQAALRESLERLDKNENGEIEPDEITPLARPYLERITKARRMSIDRPNRIDKLQEAARIHYALQNGVSNDRVRPQGESSVKTFEPDPDQPLVPEFGLAEVKYPYTQDDLDFADRTLKSHDNDKDGYINRAEAEDDKWTHRNPFDDDLNKDDRLSRLELAQRYARRRLLENDSDELRRKAWRAGNGIRPSRPEGQEKRDDSQWWKRGGSNHWLTASLLGRFDLNKNGRLEEQESQTLGLPTAQIDVDRDGDLTRDELHAYLTRIQDDLGDLSQGLPGWFYELDANRDRQVSMAEFATEWTGESLQQFTSIDTNGDGFVTSQEVIQSKSMVGGSYSNRNAEPLPPGRTIISEIEISEDMLVGDLNVQLSITHTHVSYLDAYLTGPDGQRVELFTEVGGNDDHFDETIFDDQSRFPITKARPPFKGTFMPEAILKQQPSLSYFNGKSAKGVWQLVVRGTRNERFGMLHRWSLFIKPQESMIGETAAAAPIDDGPQSSPFTSAWPVQQADEPEPTPFASHRPAANPQSASRPKIDYEAIGRRMEEAVRAGKMTEAQVAQAWVAIKARANEQPGVSKADKGRGEYDKDADKGPKSSRSREEAIERYKQKVIEAKRRGNDKD